MRRPTLLACLALAACGGADSPLAASAGPSSSFVSGDADRLYTEAMAAWRGGDADQAETLFRQSLEANPRYLAAHISLGDLLLAAQRFGEALGSFDAAIALRPVAADAQVGRARSLAGLARLEEAAFAATTAATLASGAGNRAVEAHAHEVSGDIAVARGTLPDAAAAYEVSLERDSSLSSARLKLSDCYRALGRSGEAVATLSRGVTDRLDAKTLTAFGFRFHELGAHDQAIDVLERSDELLGGDIETVSLLASSYVRSSRLTQGLQRASEAVALAPDHVPAYVTRGEAYLGQGLVEQAADDARAALAREPENYDAIVLWADVETAVRRPPRTSAPDPQAPDATAFEDAIDAYLQAIAIAPDQLRAVDHLATLYASLNLWPELVGLIEPRMGQADTPSGWTAHMVAALLGLGRRADAVPYQSVLALSVRDDATLHYEAARAALEFGSLDPNVTLDHATRAVRLSGASPLEYRLALFDALMLNGRRDEAAEVLRETSNLFPNARELQERRQQLR